MSQIWIISNSAILPYKSKTPFLHFIMGVVKLAHAIYQAGQLLYFWVAKGRQKENLFIAKNAHTISCMFYLSSFSTGTKSNRILVVLSCMYNILTNQFHLHIIDSLFCCRHWQQSLNTYQIKSCFISSHNTVKNIKLMSVLLYSPRAAIELGGDAWDGSQGRIWLIIKQLQRHLDL